MPCLCGEDRTSLSHEVILSFPRRRESMVALVDSRLRGNDGLNGYYLYLKTEEKQHERPNKYRRTS
jgi:hypothetical protein